jgi:hypothetical protein
MLRSLHSRLRDLLAVSLVVLAASPFTAPFSTCDLADHHGLADPHQAEILAAKLAAGEDLAVVGALLEATTASPVFVPIVGSAVVDEISKHEIPSRILRL